MLHNNVRRCFAVLSPLSQIRRSVSQPTRSSRWWRRTHWPEWCVSSTAFCQCHGVAKTTALVANPPANNIQDIAVITYKTRTTGTPAYLSHLTTNQKGHYGLLTNCYFLYHGWHFRCQLKLSASALLQSGTHCHITVVPLNCSVLSSVT